jgi:hypothetical protein
MKTSVKLMPANRPASVLELLGLLQGKSTDGADQTDKHQGETGKRDRRGPEQQRSAAHENESTHNVNDVGKN